MASNVTWFVMLKSARTPSHADVANALEDVMGAELDESGECAFSLTLDDCTLDVGLESEPHVVEESREIAEDQDDERVAAWMADCDTRFVLTHPAEDADELVNVIIEASDRLAELTGGVVFDASNGELISAPSALAET